MTEKSRNILGIIGICLLSIVVFSIFFGNLFDKLNRVSFANGGDGVQSYINMEYHIRYDTSYMRCNSMNYPYGEHIFFTNNQPLFSNTVRFISENIVDISGYTLGMLNFLMLFSLMVTPFIVYLIFRHLKTGRVLSIIASIAIAFLTPQMDRFAGHYNLSYTCGIPFMILLLLKFFNKPSVLLSIIIFITMMAGALAHFYWYGFFGLLMIFMYADEFITRRSLNNNRLAALHLFVQLVLPFLILQAFYISDHVTDRPGYPWGFLHYRAYPQSVFLPLNKPYGQFLHSFIPTSYIDWEGYAIIGTVALAGFIYFLFRLFQKIRRKEYALIWQVTNNRFLNCIFWASLTGLLYSFGIPFIFGLEWLVDLIGPLRQMRGIARFAWVFYYVINIITIYWLWTWWLKDKRKNVLLILSLSVFILCLDAWYNVKGRGKWLENQLPVLTDQELVQPENQWIRRIKIDNYQAFIPIPYFHIGSENIWMDGGCEIVSRSFAVIKNTGLPCMGVMLSRTSISQTVENISLMLGPACDQLNMKRFPSQKPFLLMVASCENLSEREKQIVKHAKQIDSSGTFKIYELPFNAFQAIADSMAKEVYLEFSDSSLHKCKDMLVSGLDKKWYMVDFDSLNNGTRMYGSGFFTGKAKNKNQLFNSVIPGADTSVHYCISFWIDQITDDLYPRTMIRINEYSTDGKLLASVPFHISKNLVMIDQNKALIEIPYKLTDPSSRMVVIMDNKTLRNKKISVDDLVVRPEDINLYRKLNTGVWKNNRIYRSCI